MLLLQILRILHLSLNSGIIPPSSSSHRGFFSQLKRLLNPALFEGVVVTKEPSNTVKTMLDQPVRECVEAVLQAFLPPSLHTMLSPIMDSIKSKAVDFLSTSTASFDVARLFTNVCTETERVMLSSPTTHPASSSTSQQDSMAEMIERLSNKQAIDALVSAVPQQVKQRVKKKMEKTFSKIGIKRIRQFIVWVLSSIVGGVVGYVAKENFTKAPVKEIRQRVQQALQSSEFTKGMTELLSTSLSPFAGRITSLPVGRSASPQS